MTNQARLGPVWGRWYRERCRRDRRSSHGGGAGTEGNGTGTEGNDRGTEGNGKGTEGNGTGKLF